MTWLSWPHNRRTWPGAFSPVPPLFARFVRTLAQYEPVHICAGGEAVLAEARLLVGDVPHVTLHDIPTNDAWCRDHGPMFLSGAGLPPALVHWDYNAWGHKYAPIDSDQNVPRRIAELQGRRRFQPGIVMEGGALEGNGCGTVLTTDSCLLNPNRNPQLGREQIEQYLADFLGAKKVLWLPRGELAGDDTDGHVDQLARFVNPTTIVAAFENNPADVNFATVQANFAQLQTMTDQDDQPLTVIPLPLPAPQLHRGLANLRMPASYCNFHIANGVVLVPQFDDPHDRLALDTLAPYFPSRQLIGLPARDLVWGLGAYHCLSQQEPV